MKTILLLFVCASVATGRAGVQSGSLLGMPVTAIVGSLDQFAIRVGRPAATGTLSPEAVRFALEHSELIDPTLPEVRANDFPLVATVLLANRGTTNEIYRIDLCGGLGLLHGGGPVPYVFRYRLADGSDAKGAGSVDSGGAASRSRPVDAGALASGAAGTRDLEFIGLTITSTKEHNVLATFAEPVGHSNSVTITFPFGWNSNSLAFAPESTPVFPFMWNSNSPTILLWNTNGLASVFPPAYYTAQEAFIMSLINKSLDLSAPPDASGFRRATQRLVFSAPTNSIVWHGADGQRADFSRWSLLSTNGPSTK
jgi:hypothetical protein